MQVLIIKIAEIPFEEVLSKNRKDKIHNLTKDELDFVICYFYSSILKPIEFRIDPAHCNFRVNIHILAILNKTKEETIINDDIRVLNFKARNYSPANPLKTLINTDFK